MPLHDVGYRPWPAERPATVAQPGPRAGGGAGVIAETGIRLAWKSRWLRRVLLFAWSPAIMFAGGFFAFEQALDEGAIGTARSMARQVDALGLLGRMVADSLGGSLAESLAEAAVVISAGAAGVTLLDAAGLKGCRKARVLIDLNAVPPVGIEGILPSDKARVLEGIREDLPPVAYGPLGVGGTKMKIHRAAIDELFVSTEAALDAEEILAIAWRLEGDSTDRG